MKALMIEKPKTISLKDVPYPRLNEDEVIVKVKKSGVCGTDLNIYKGDYNINYPIIPGHEFSGIVDKLGKNVEGIKEGDRVAVDPSYSCGKCKFCLANRKNLCIDFGGIGTTQPGGMAEYVSVPKEKIFILPDFMSYTEAAFVEPVACVLNALSRLKVKIGDKILLFGVGSMGLQLLQGLVHAGASELIVVDKSSHKLKLAKELGATEGVLSEHVEEKLSNRKFDIAIDATGNTSVIQQIFQFMDGGAKFLQFGVTSPESYININPFDVYNQEWSIMGSMSLNNKFLPAFNWIKEERINLSPLVTSEVSLEESIRFFEKPNSIEELKVHISM